MLAFYRLPNLRKSKHHLVHDRVTRSVGLFLISRQKLICMHVYKELMQCKSVCDVKSRIDPRPFSLGRVPNDAYFFINLEAYKKLTFSKKEHNAFPTAAKIYFSKKGIMGLGAL